MDLKIVEQSGTPTSFSLVAECNGQKCGYLDAKKIKVGGRVAYTVSYVSVSDDFQRRGIGTKLYEAAHAKACARRARLASTERHSWAKSNDFWNKQVCRGRAEVYAGKHPDTPVFVLKSCDIQSLSGLKKPKKALGRITRRRR